MLNIDNILENVDLELLGQIKTMQEKLKKKLAQVEVTGEAGGGLITIHGTAQGKVTNIHIDDSLLAEQTSKTLTDLLVAAFNNMHQKAIAEAEQFKKKESMSMIPDWLNEGN